MNDPIYFFAETATFYQLPNFAPFGFKLGNQVATSEKEALPI